MKINKPYLNLVASLALIATGCGKSPKVDSPQLPSDNTLHSAPAVARPQPFNPSVDEQNWHTLFPASNISAFKRKHHDVAAARTYEEGKWLERQGFLSSSEVDYLSSLPRTDLENRVRSGDVNATIFLGQQLIDAGQGKRIQRALQKIALEQANIPAMYLSARTIAVELADTSNRSSASIANDRSLRAEAASYLLMAYSRGDYRASQLLFSLYPDGVPPAAFTEGMRQVQRMDAAYRARHGDVRAVVDPRPVPDETLGLVETSDDFFR